MKISVVIAVHNREEQYLTECLQSVIAQSSPPHEIILVDILGDDGYARELISRVGLPAVKCVFYDDNKRYHSAVVEGCRSSSGEVVCFLDGDDRFYDGKLDQIAKFFEDNPQEIAVTHACVVISKHAESLSLWRPKSRVGIADCLLQEPMPLSAVAIRRSCIREWESFPAGVSVQAGWLDFVVRLLSPSAALKSIDRPLCAHRVVDAYTEETLQESIQVLQSLFSDPTAPESLLRLRESALARIHLKSAYEAFVRGDGEAGREMLRSSIYLDRSILDVQAYRFFFFLISESVKGKGEHQICIEQVFEQLPSEMLWMTPHRNEVIARGFLLRGVRAVLWGRIEEGKMNLSEAVRLGCRIDPYFYFALSEELQSFETVFSPAEVDLALRILTPYLKTMSAPSFVRWFKGEFFANRAFREFERGKYWIVLQSIQNAFLARPSFIANRGLLAALFRSLGRLRSDPV